MTPGGSPQPGAPYTYVTTKGFLAHFGLDTLHDLPDLEALEDAGLLIRDGDDGAIPVAAGDSDSDVEPSEVDDPDASL